jgi:hypothetical protein
MNYLVWGAWGSIVFFAVALIGRSAGVEMPVGIATMSNFSLVLVGFFWGSVLCFTRDWLRKRHG